MSAGDLGGFGPRPRHGREITSALSSLCGQLYDQS